MTDERGDPRVDLSPLAHDRDPAAHARAVATIMRRAASELARRRAAGSPIGQLAGWWRPLLAMAAVLTVVAVGVLARVTPSAVTIEADTPRMGQWLGMPSTVASWLEANQAPSPVQVFAALQEDR